MNKHYRDIQNMIDFERKNYKGPFCCIDMDSILNKKNESPIYKIGYYPDLREYFLESVEGYICNINFCPWCGSELPKSLSDRWFQILEEEHELDMPDLPEQKAKIPTEFLTDEWWKKRGL